ncbi:hypothetical protein E4U17_000008 [Claviceps sp. LM77 group G4]|nr:hypothetical protein E4U17_000008 [Claviceps sp. LM77 group G4]KAG6085835.1 hypothetical protein E4U16_000048 [Claviceps sp. LM84 group G4]KAG6086497.1 hypothetical protein E4U33_004550 [Claviceps sp. LM78 group G4]
MLSSEPPQKRQNRQHISHEKSITDDDDDDDDAVAVDDEETPEEQIETPSENEVLWERENEEPQPQLSLASPAVPKKPARTTRPRGSSRGKIASGCGGSRNSSGSPTDKTSDDERKPRTRTHCHGGFEFTFRLWDDGVWRIEGTPKRIADTAEADISEMVPDETAQINEDETSEDLLLEIGTGS